MGEQRGTRFGLAWMALAAVAFGVGWAVFSALSGPGEPGPRGWQAGSEPSQRPHVLLISIDTLRADHLSSYGYERRTSPVIDTLASQGVLFEEAYSHSPKTAPSHMSLMTSLYPESHGVRQLSHEQARRLSDDIPTLATVLQRNGYRTCGITSGGNASAKLGFDQGMHSFQTIYDAGQLMQAAAVQIEAMQGVKAEREPLFLFLHTYEVHDPYTPPLPYRDLFTDPNYSGDIVGDMQEIGETGSELFEHSHRFFWDRVDRNDPEDVQRLRDLYDGSIRRVDTELSRLVSWMRSKHIFDDTLIVILSDHGEEFGDHGGFLHTRVYQELLHVPLIMLFPGADRSRYGNQRIAAPVRLIDVMPTLLDYLDLAPPPGIQGQSLLPLITGKGEGPPPRVMSSYARRGYLSLREDRWKLVQHVSRRLSGTGLVMNRELYDLGADPKEMHNLAEGESERVRELAELAASLEEQAKAVYEAISPGPRIDADEQTTEELRALGYIE